MKSIDIARLAGVSRSTVSRVINNYSNVPKETKDKVMKVINEHNYMPNSFARTLAGKKSNTIGLFFVISGGDKNTQTLFMNDYFASYLDILVDMATRRDYYILVSIVTEKEQYLQINQAFHEKRIDGGIIIGTEKDTLSHIHAQGLNTSLVLFDYDIDEKELEKYKETQFTIINSNDEKGIGQAVDYLYSLGHREIGFIEGKEATRSGIIRREAFKKGLDKHNLIINEDYSIKGDFLVETAYRETNKMIKSKKSIMPTAYISANDYMALGAIRAFTENGYDIPKDISIIGFDNTHRAQEFSPKLTTIGPRFYKMAQKAIDVIDAQIKNDTEPVHVQSFEYDVDLYKRDTCIKLD